PGDGHRQQLRGDLAGRRAARGADRQRRAGGPLPRVVRHLLHGQGGGAPANVSRATWLQPGDQRCHFGSSKVFGPAFATTLSPVISRLTNLSPSRFVWTFVAF